MTMPPKKTAKHSIMRADGRSTKGAPRLQNWFAQVFISEHVLVPAWRHMSKTATDIAIICIAKQNKAFKFKDKFGGPPVFQFRYSEGVKMLSVCKNTFNRAIHELLEIGFIELVSPGGMTCGRGIAADYTLGKRWRDWQPPPPDTRNIEKARKALKKK
jgi:hypothetical protein